MGGGSRSGRSTEEADFQWAGAATETAPPILVGSDTREQGSHKSHTNIVFTSDTADKATSELFYNSSLTLVHLPVVTNRMFRFHD